MIRQIAPLLVSAPACAALLIGCNPDVDIDESVVSHPQVVAVRAVPAEARPGGEVRYEALIVAPEGGTTPGRLHWSYCTARPEGASTSAVATACVEEGSGLEAIGEGTGLSGRLPADGCARFGPEPPPLTDGGSGGRPSDPDYTGGYQQPIVLEYELDGDWSLSTFEQRIRCELGGATPEAAAQYRREYRENMNPELLYVRFLREGQAIAESACSGENEPVRLPGGVELEVEAGWPDCVGMDECGDGVCSLDESTSTCSADCLLPLGCAGAEEYLVYNARERSLVRQREALRFRWLATTPGLALERTGIASTETSTAATHNRLNLPLDSVSGTLWVVARDDRGGTGWCRVDYVAGD